MHCKALRFGGRALCDCARGCLPSKNILDRGARLPYRNASRATPRSSSGLGHQPLTLGTGVRNPYGAPSCIQVDGLHFHARRACGCARGRRVVRDHRCERSHPNGALGRMSGSTRRSSVASGTAVAGSTNFPDALQRIVGQVSAEPTLRPSALDALSAAGLRAPQPYAGAGSTLLPARSMRRLRQ